MIQYDLFDALVELELYVEWSIKMQLKEIIVCEWIEDDLKCWINDGFLLCFDQNPPT